MTVKALPYPGKKTPNKISSTFDANNTLEFEMSSNFNAFARHQERLTTALRE